MRAPTIRLEAVAGGAGGSWYLMEGLARLVIEIHPEIRIEVVAGGGVSNHARIGAGEDPCIPARRDTFRSSEPAPDARSGEDAR